MKPSFLPFDPTKYLVGELNFGSRRLSDGIHEVATDKESGVTLWAKVAAGLTICIRATDQHGVLLETFTVFRPSAGRKPAAEGKVPPSPEVFERMMAECGYVCTAGGGDGGMICWKVCN